MREKKEINLNTKVEKRLNSMLEEYAKKQCCSKSTIVRQAINEWAERQAEKDAVYKEYLESK